MKEGEDNGVRWWVCYEGCVFVKYEVVGRNQKKFKERDPSQYSSEGSMFKKVVLAASNEGKGFLILDMKQSKKRVSIFRKKWKREPFFV